MNAKVEIIMRISRYCDLSKSARDIHGVMWGDAAKALREAGFDCSLEELILKQSDVMEAARLERE